MKLNFQWPPAIMYCVTFLVLGFLVYSGRAHIEVLLAQLTWLAPSPIQATSPVLSAVGKPKSKKPEEPEGPEEPEKPETD
jgi:hypothetical protein